MNDLPKRMDTTISPTSSVDDNGLAFVNTSQGFFDFFLNAPSMRLALKARKVMSVVGNKALITSHVLILTGKKACRKRERIQLSGYRKC